MLLPESVILSFTARARSCLNEIAFHPVTCEIAISEIEASWNVVRLPQCTFKLSHITLVHVCKSVSFCSLFFSILNFEESLLSQIAIVHNGIARMKMTIKKQLVLYL